MKQKELSDKLEKLVENLKKANTDNDVKKINENVDSLNKLWDKASEEMLSNAKKEGFFKPEKD
tara:strand:- start:1470 stop:1658 length:189 start_codon:yes stop_codon:yes gene_type:complete